MTNNSKLWTKLTANEFSNVNEDFLATFRAPGNANKFVAWDPFERSSRYFKFLLFGAAQRQEKEFYSRYKKINNRGLGNPITIEYSECAIDADYFAAVEEFSFLEKNGNFDEIENIVEIGAGFGRTCHTILSLWKNVKKYTIIDLDSMLFLSKNYLERVAPELISKVQFVSSNDFSAQVALAPDLTINIDSFQEMPEAVIDGYMDRVVRHSSYFYSKNAVGKYLPESVGMPDLRSDQLFDVFELGRCKNVINIYSDAELQKARLFCVDAYTPKFDGLNWTAVADKPMDLFPYFHHVLYSIASR